MPEDVEIKVDALGNVGVMARQVRAIDTQDGTIEVDTRGLFIQSSQAVPGMTVEKITGMTVVREIKY